MALIEHGVPVPCVSLINGYLRTSNSLTGRIWKLHLCSLIDLFTFLLSLFTRFICLFTIWFVRSTFSLAIQIFWIWTWNIGTLRYRDA